MLLISIPISIFNRMRNSWRLIRDRLYHLGISGVLIFLYGCTDSKESMFELVSSKQSGITFRNEITETDSLNVLRLEYIYNGGGVGVGDFNNDGLPDIFFSGNQVPGKLYINKGDFRFEDITLKSGIETLFWSTGVALVDINNDGLLDIYLSTISPTKNQSVPNQFFINKGIENGLPSFKEEAQEIGLADRGYTTQAAFFDYDNDGDLDCYLLTNSLEDYNRSLPLGQRNDGLGKSTDRLYRNDGLSESKLPKFVNVSKEAGITIEGWGLGIGVSDFNQDGWMDVYCANDFQSNDLLWINNQNGTFSNRIDEMLQHQSANSMGMDIADINNDGLPEIVNLDMMPEDNLRQKMMFSKPAYDRFAMDSKKGYQPQFIRNSLQLNRGIASSGLPIFSDISYMTGVYATDWSWSALFADFDNDGNKDLFITNGYKMDVTNMDFVAYDAQVKNFSSNMTGETAEERLKRMDDLLGVKKSNVMFRNLQDLNFENVTNSWGLEIPSYSNGAAYADFDNDGDLDIVINNLNDEAFLYRNNVIEGNSKKENVSNFLTIQLQGNKSNTQGFGSNLSVFSDGKRQYVEQSPYRGYKSTVDARLHVGLGTSQKIDSIKITWPGRASETLYNVAANQFLVLKETDAEPLKIKTPRNERVVLFKDVTQRFGIQYNHTENDFVDFKYQPLLPHKHSQLGPALAVGDLDGDKREDFIVGGSAHRTATIFYQQKDGIFIATSFEEKISEDMGVLLIDVDNDNDLDIYCVSGSTEFGKTSQHYQSRLYKNLGKGKFILDALALPQMESSGSCVVANDFDRDGDLDLFVGGRVSPFSYPLAPLSYALQNNGLGKYIDATKEIAPELERIGMVTSALWTDFDNDGWTDLIVVGEFMPLTFFKNDQGKLNKYQPDGIRSEATVGWWNSISGGDFDNDGDIDYVAGNLGLNSIYQASEAEPVCVYAKDYDQTGSIDPVLCRYIAGKEYPAHYRESMTDQMTGLRRKLTRYELYGRMTFRNIFDEEATRDAMIYKATNFASVYIENRGRGKFTIKSLPKAAQFAPIFGTQVVDFDLDGNLDLIAVGNDHSPDPLTGQLDGSIGTVLKGDGSGNFESLSLAQTGFLVRGDAKAFASIVLSNKMLLLVSQNKDSLKAFEGLKHTEFISLNPYDAWCETNFKNGKKQKTEFYIGSGYLSQSSRLIPRDGNVKKIEIMDSRGQKRIVQ